MEFNYQLGLHGSLEYVFLGEPGIEWLESTQGEKGARFWASKKVVFTKADGKIMALKFPFFHLVFGTVIVISVIIPA